jgi:hypothetical protein
MSGEPTLYEKVWGEPPPIRPSDETPAPDQGLIVQSPLPSTPEPSLTYPGTNRTLTWTKTPTGGAHPPEGAPETWRWDSQPHRTEGGWDGRVLARLDAIEATLLRLQNASIENRRQLEKCVADVSDAVAEIQRSVRQSRDASSSQERVLTALEALEARMIRTEKGLIRTLEYFQLKLSATERHQ